MAANCSREKRGTSFDVNDVKVY